MWYKNKINNNVIIEIYHIKIKYNNNDIIEIYHIKIK